MPLKYTVVLFSVQSYVEDKTPHHLQSTFIMIYFNFQNSHNGVNICFILKL